MNFIKIIFIVAISTFLSSQNSNGQEWKHFKTIDGVSIYWLYKQEKVATQCYYKVKVINNSNQKKNASYELDFVTATGKVTTPLTKGSVTLGPSQAKIHKFFITETAQRSSLNAGGKRLPKLNISNIRITRAL